MNETFVDFYRCPETFANFSTGAQLSTQPGFFRFGRDLVCFGQCASGRSAALPNNGLYDTLSDVIANHASIRLPFDLTQVVNNLRLERYMPGSDRGAVRRVIRDGYYLVRPALGVPIRRRLQRIFLRDWDKLPFPRWPVDTTVEQLFEKLMSLALQSQKVGAVPFIWFWPNGASSCVMMTHDVETAAGADFCSKLMDLDDTFGIRASFQIVPEERYPVSPALLDEIRQRGFELNIQDFNHDGHLFRDRQTFLTRAQAINRCAEAYGCRGFRSAAMYRNPDWYEALAISYDLSFPNVAHLEPQRGGCCTVFPYFIGDILELPLTTAQDYSLFHILDEYSTELWERQIGIIQQSHGLVSFIVHPDYIVPKRPRRAYMSLLERLAGIRAAGEAWFALPGEVNTWWRARAGMRVTLKDGRWTVEGPGSECARVAFAALQGGRLTYTIQTASAV